MEVKKETRERCSAEQTTLSHIRDKYTPYLGQMQEGSQKYQIMNYMMRYGGITSMIAFQAFGITRLSGRIFDLRSMGIEVETELVKSKSRKGAVSYAVYSLK